MKAMILAAGRGGRMRPLTDSIPKPLLNINGQALIDYHIYALKKAGVDEIIVNVAWLAEQLLEHLGDGSDFGIPIRISHEQHGALETAGGIANALSLLGNKPFIVVNADIWTDYDFSLLPCDIDGLLHLVMVNNPTHHPDGDFYYHNKKLWANKRQTKLTFSGIGVYKAELFRQVNSITPLKPLIDAAIRQKQASAEFFNGEWQDIGTPERLQNIIARDYF